MLDVLGIRNAQKLIPLQEDQKPKDPVTENMDVLIGKPLKAFIYQDQDAHLMSHNSFLQDPSQQLLQQNQVAAAQQQAQQQMQDPIIQMQMQELQIKQQEVQRKAQKDQADIAIKQEQLSIDRERIIAQEQLEGTKLGAKMAKEKDELDRKDQIEGTRMGIDMAHKKDQIDTQKGQIAAQLIAAQINASRQKKDSK